MKAITLYQPWATLISIGAKKIETRSWATGYRGSLAIHSSSERKYIDIRSKYYVCDKEPFYSILMSLYLDDLSLPRGFIIAICELESCFPIHEGPLLISEQEKAFGDYTVGRYMWFLDKIQQLENPILVKGKMGLWEWNGRSSSTAKI